MLQQNNNNNYPCLSMSAPPREMQSCPRASLPLPSRLELSLGDLPLIRGLRAWALCSKNRKRADGLAGGGRAPTAAPAGRGGSAAWDWGGMGYGLPLDARQAGLGALVTVATLKTSEGGGKTQTQCLFLRTERSGSLYSNAAVATSATPGLVGEWLRGKMAGGGGRDAPPGPAGANQVRARAGRRWRKSGKAAGRGGQQRSRGGPQLAAEGRQEGGGGPDQAESPAGGVQDRLGRQQSEEEGGEVCESEPNCEVVAGAVDGLSDHGGAREESSLPLGGADFGPVGLGGPDFGLGGAAAAGVCRFPADEGSRKLNQNTEAADFLPEDENNSRLEESPPPRLNILESNGGESTCSKMGGGSRDAPGGSRPQEPADGGRTEDRDAPGQTTITGVRLDQIVSADPPTSAALSNPAPPLPPLATMATGLPCLEAEEEEGVSRPGEDGGWGEERRQSRALEGEEEEEEEEFGVFMQAEGGAAWSEGVNMSASVPCRSRESSAAGEKSSSCRADDAWTAFPQDASNAAGDVEPWWPISADRPSTNHSLPSVFVEAFPPPPDSSSRDSGDLADVPTLTQLLRGRASRDQGLLDSFHDLNKMIGQRYKKANGVSGGLLLRTLHLEPPHVESRPVSWTTNRRLSPGLPSANQHAQSAAAKRRLSYDYNRNILG